MLDLGGIDVEAIATDRQSANVEIAGAFGHLASTERQDPGERFEGRTKPGHPEQ
jgi:hypothetical protein